jgi:hypothetical protein
MWGDSLTPPVALNLAIPPFFPDREVYNGGIGGQTSTQIATRMLADTSGHNTWINVFWYGQNNESDPAQIKADLAASVAALAPGNSRFLVLSVVNKAIPEESRGSALYATIIQLNAELAALYPQNFFDVRTFLVNQYQPYNPQDVIDFQNDVPPSSLRFPGDIAHLINDGSVLVAQQIFNFINAKGW